MTSTIASSSTIGFPAHLLPELFRLLCLWKTDLEDHEGNPLPLRGELLAWAEQEIDRAPHEVEEGLYCWSLFQRHPVARRERLEAIRHALSAVLTQEEAETYPALALLYDLIQDMKRKEIPGATWDGANGSVWSLGDEPKGKTYPVEIHEGEG